MENTAQLETTALPDEAARITDTTIGSVLRAAAARAPDASALVFGDRRWTYADLLAEATDGARALLASFLPGDAIAVWAENCPQWIALEFAAALADLTLVPVSPAAGADEVAHALAHSQARGIFLGAGEVQGSSRTAILRSVEHRLPSLRFTAPLSQWDAVRAIGSLGSPLLPEADPGRPAQILYTSGTTGQPRAVMVTHRALTNNARLAMGVFGGRDGDTIVSTLPLAHIAGCGLVTLGTAQLAGTLVLLPDSGPALQPSRVLSRDGQHGGTLLCTEPATLSTLLTGPSPRGRDVRSLRAVISVGAPVSPDLALEAEAALGVPVLTGLAQTESSGMITATSAGDSLADRLGGVGRPLPGSEVRIVGLHTGETAPCGDVGEIWVRGYQVMRGYIDDPRPDATVLAGDGWLRTGDLGAMDSRGYCRVVGRVRELIVRGGQDIHPREIETVLLEHPDVAEVAVVGVQDAFWDSTVAAIVRLSGRLDDPAAELTEFCGARLAACKVPVRWLFVDSFPRTARGDVRKFALSNRLAGATGPDWQSWAAQSPSDLSGTLGAGTSGWPDLIGSLAELLDLRVPQQVSRSKALEDIDS